MIGPGHLVRTIKANRVWSHSSTADALHRLQKRIPICSEVPGPHTVTLGEGGEGSGNLKPIPSRTDHGKLLVTMNLLVTVIELES